MANTTPIWKRRWFIAVASVLVVLVLAVVVVLPMLLDVERYRPHIEQALRDQTGWEPTLGAIEVSLFPSPALHVEASSLDSPHTESAIAIGSLDVAASFWPLLKGTVAIDDVTLDRPQVTLVREAGAVTWDIPGPPGAAAEPRTKPADTGTRPPRAEPPQAEGQPQEEPRDSVLDVAVQRVRLRNGEVHIEDRSVDPPRTLALAPFTVTIQPLEGSLGGSAELVPDGGTLRWEGTFANGITITLEEIATGQLAAIVGSDLLRPGGTLSGTVDVGVPFAVDGALHGSNLALATAQQSIEAADLAFRVVADPVGLQLESTRLTLGELNIEGAGRLTPALDLGLQIPESPLEAALEAVRGLMHFPLDVEGPGSIAADIVVFQDEDATLRYAANGTLSAHRLIGAEFLPSADDVKTRFDLTPGGQLTVDIAEGTVAGGPMRGKVVLDRVDPPGVLRFDGTLRRASMGGLLAGFVADAAEKITGPTSVQASLSLDLGQEVVDAHAVGGTLKLSSGQVTLPGWDVEAKIENRLAGMLDNLALTALVDKNKLADLGTSDVPVAFDGLNADVNLDSLPWTLDNLRLTRDGGALTGTGSFDPLAGDIALGIDVELSVRNSTRLVEKYDKLAALRGDDGRIRLPLGLEGALDQPGLTVNLGDIAVGLLGKDDVRKDLVNKLKGLFDDDDD